MNWHVIVVQFWWCFHTLNARCLFLFVYLSVSLSAEEEEDHVEELVANGSDEEQAGPPAHSTPIINHTFGPVLMTVQPAK